MFIKVYARGFTLSEALNEYIDAKLRLALGLYREKIRRTDVFLTDVNGPKGGEDMNCKIQIKADGHPIIIVSGKSDDMYEAINIGSHKVKRAVGRRVNRVLRRRKVSLDTGRAFNSEASPSIR